MTVHVIIGAGQSGAHAAVAMREAGFAGRIVVLGEELHHPHERPPLSKQMLTAAAEPDPTHFHAPDRYAAHEIELRLGVPAVSIDRDAARVMLADGSNMPYDRLLLATGGRPRMLSIPGCERVRYLRTLDDARTIRRRLHDGARVVCIGAGVIGLEIASSARHRGCVVTVLEAGPGVMGRSLPAIFARRLERLHREAGVALESGVTLERIEPDRVICAGAEHPADLVVAGIGLIRNTELAEAAGIAVDQGILVDAFGATDAPGIYAAGDVAAFWHPTLHRRLRQESWRHAQNHGIAVGRAMAGGDAPYDDIPWFWTDQHGVNLQMAGLITPTSRTILRGDPDGPTLAGFDLDEAGCVIAATGLNAPREVRAGQALIRAMRPIDPALLENPSVPLQRIAASTGL